jgi:hypothetical protein
MGDPVSPRSFRGAAQAASPESITSAAAYGFRAPRCARPRNDGGANPAQQSSFSRGHQPSEVCHFPARDNARGRSADPLPAVACFRRLSQKPVFIGVLAFMLSQSFAYCSSLSRPEMGAKLGAHLCGLGIA